MNHEKFGGEKSQELSEGQWDALENGLGVKDVETLEWLLSEDYEINDEALSKEEIHQLLGKALEENE